MFPDGGYAVGDDYGEMAHWEPFQDRYLAWIRENYQPPWNDEAATHIAFLLGMASHGMADQVYDSTFMEGSKAANDPGWTSGCDALDCSFDTATDILWAHLNGPQVDPERWIPESQFVELYKQAGHETPVETMLKGSNLVGTAITLVGLGGPDQSLYDQGEANYPWVFPRMNNPERGAPRNIAVVVEAYWHILWERLNGGTWTGTPVMATMPPDGSYGLIRDHNDVGARLGVVFSRGLRKSELKADSFSLVDSKGNAHPFDVDLFYGESSHVVNIHPKADFAENETYTLTVAAGITALDGTQSTEPFSFSVHTSPPPVPPEQPKEKDGGCSSAPIAWFALLVPAVWRVRRKRA
jgi:hypothetical protein